MGESFIEMVLDALVIIVFIGTIIISTALFGIFRELKDIGNSLYKISKHLESIDENEN